MLNNNLKLKKEKDELPFYIKKFKTIVFLIMLAIVAIAYYFFIGPQYQQHKTNQNKLDQLDKQRQFSLQQLQASKKIMADFESISQLDKTKINQILPSKAYLSNIYINLKAITQQNDLGITAMTVTPIKTTAKKKLFADNSNIKVKHIGLIDINLTLDKVSYAKLKKLFSYLEINIRLFDITSFSFNPVNGNLNILFKTYYLLNT